MAGVNRPQDIETALQQSSSIPKLACQVTIGPFFGLAVLSIVARIYVRIHTRRRLALNDYILFFSAACLAGATSITYLQLNNFYLGNAAQLNPVLPFSLSAEDLESFIEFSPYLAALQVLTWTCIFGVKLSFLAFFHDLTNRLKGIRIYYWIVLVVVVVSWLFTAIAPTMLCRHYGLESVQCLNPSRATLYLVLPSICVGLDCLTDLLVVSIPILILHRSNLALRQKVALGTFLCLSFVVFALALVRGTRYKRSTSVDIVWMLYFHSLEASIAVCMASLTAFRTLFVFRQQSREQSGETADLPQHTKSLKQSIKSRKGWSPTNTFARPWRESEDSFGRRGYNPGAVLVGIRSFHRTPPTSPKERVLPPPMPTLLDGHAYHHVPRHAPTQAPSRQYARTQHRQENPSHARAHAYTHSATPLLIPLPMQQYAQAPYRPLRTHNASPSVSSMSETITTQGSSEESWLSEKEVYRPGVARTNPIPPAGWDWVRRKSTKASREAEERERERRRRFGEGGMVRMQAERYM